MDSNNFKLSIIIPIYNEEEALVGVLSSIINTINPLGITYEIIAVNDCSKDRSGNILKNFPSVKTISHTYNRGYGASLKTGIKTSRYDWIMIIDGDGTYPVDVLPEMIKETERYDMIIGARDKNSEGIPSERKLAKKFLNRFAGYLAGKTVPDLNSGMRLFKKEMVLNYWDIFPDRFSFTSTLTMIGMAKGYETSFVPIDYYKRQGESSLKAKHFFNFLKLVTKLSLFFKPLKVFGPLSLLMFLGALTIPTAFLLGATDKFFDTTFVAVVALAIQTFFFGLLAEIVIHNRKY